MIKHVFYILCSKINLKISFIFTITLSLIISNMNSTFAEITIGPRIGFPLGIGVETQIKYDKFGGRTGLFYLPNLKKGKSGYYHIPALVDYYLLDNAEDFKFSGGIIFNNMSKYDNKYKSKFSPVLSMGVDMRNEKFERFFYIAELGAILYQKKPVLMGVLGCKIEL